MTKFKPKFQYTDHGNGLRLSALCFSKEYDCYTSLYITEWKEWIHWTDNNKWVRDGRNIVMDRYVDDLLADILKEVEEMEEEVERLEGVIGFERLTALCNKAAPETDDEKKILAFSKFIQQAEKHYENSQSAPRMTAAAKRANTRKGISNQIANFDTKGKWIGVLNGKVNVLTGEFVKNDPRFLMTKSCAVNYEPNAICPKFDEFMKMIFRGDTDKINFIKRLMGQSLLGLSIKDKCVIFYGGGANGKSTLCDLMFKILDDYATEIDEELLTTGGRSSSTQYFMAALKGVRLGLINEIEASSQLADTVIRKIVDSGEVSARSAYGHPFTFQPVVTPIISCNDKPYVDGTSYGIWRRMLLVNFDYTIQEKRKILDYHEELFKEEGSGVLNWCIEGCQDFVMQGYKLNPPQSILNETEEYRDEQDRPLQFITDTLEYEVGARIKWKDVYQEYVRWTKENSIKGVKTKSNWKKEMLKKGIQFGQALDNNLCIFDYKYNEDLMNEFHTIAQLGYVPRKVELGNEMSLQKHKSKRQKHNLTETTSVVQKSPESVEQIIKDLNTTVERQNKEKES